MKLLYNILTLPHFLDATNEHYIEDVCRIILNLEGIETEDLYEIN